MAGSRAASRRREVAIARVEVGPRSGLAPSLLRSTHGTPVANDAARLGRALPNETLLALDHRLGQVNGDLMRPRPDGQLLCSPERWPQQGVLPDRREPAIRRDPSSTHQLEHLADAADPCRAELRLGWSDAIAGKPVRRDTQRVTGAAGRRVLDLHAVAELDRDRVPEHGPQGPLPIAGAVEKIVRAADEQAHQVAVRRLDQIEDPLDLRARCWRGAGEQGLFLTEQVVQRGSDPAGELPVTQRRQAAERIEWSWDRRSA